MTDDEEINYPKLCLILILRICKNKATSELIKASVEPTLEPYRAIVLSSKSFSKFTLGSVAPQFTGDPWWKKIHLRRCEEQISETFCTG